MQRDSNQEGDRREPPAAPRLRPAPDPVMKLKAFSLPAPAVKPEELILEESKSGNFESGNSFWPKRNIVPDVPDVPVDSDDSDDSDDNDGVVGDALLTRGL